MTEKLKKCKDCKYYDTAPYPEHKGNIACCRGKSWLFKIGCKTIAGTCFERKKDEQ